MPKGRRLVGLLLLLWPASLPPANDATGTTRREHPDDASIAAAEKLWRRDFGTTLMLIAAMAFAGGALVLLVWIVLVPINARPPTFSGVGDTEAFFAGLGVTTTLSIARAATAYATAAGGLDHRDGPSEPEPAMGAHVHADVGQRIDDMLERVGTLVAGVLATMWVVNCLSVFRDPQSHSKADIVVVNALIVLASALTAAVPIRLDESPAERLRASRRLSRAQTLKEQLTPLAGGKPRPRAARFTSLALILPSTVIAGWEWVEVGQRGLRLGGVLIAMTTLVALTLWFVSFVARGLLLARWMDTGRVRSGPLAVGSWVALTYTCLVGPVVFLYGSQDNGSVYDAGILEICTVATTTLAAITLTIRTLGYRIRGATPLQAARALKYTSRSIELLEADSRARAPHYR